MVKTLDDRLRREFRLPGEDEIYLDSLGFPWETIKNNGSLWLLINEHTVSNRYTADRTTVAIRIEGGYPPGQLDMVYFCPALLRKDGKAIRASSDHMIEGKTFQRWSRHYKWQDGSDTLITHHLRIKEWINDELARG